MVVPHEPFGVWAQVSFYQFFKSSAMGFHSADYMHAVIEARESGADGSGRVLWPPELYASADGFATRMRRELIDPDKASLEVRTAWRKIVTQCGSLEDSPFRVDSHAFFGTSILALAHDHEENR